MTAPLSWSTMDEHHHLIARKGSAALALAERGSNPN
jgi:hypothetical protein